MDGEQLGRAGTMLNHRWVSTGRGRWLKEPVAGGIGLGVGQILTLVVGLGAMTILMRKLGPEPFGLVAMAGSLAVVFSVIAESGVGASLVSDRAFNERRVGAAVLLSVGLGLVLGLLALGMTPLVVAFYHDERVGVIWMVACALLVLSALASVPNALAQRHERFWVLSWVPLVSSMAAAVSAVLLAQVRDDFWPILLRQAVGVVLISIGMWVAIRPRMQWPTKADMLEVYRFARGVVGFNLLNTVNRHADSVIIGRFLGEHALGLYLLAYKVLLFPLTQINGIVRTIAYPRLSRLGPDWTKIGQWLALLMRDVALVATPVCLGIAVAAPEIILVLFGEAWSEALVPFRVLALLGVYQVPFALAGLAYMVTRKTDVMARWGAFSTPPIVLSFFVGLPWGIEGVATAYAVTSLALAVPLTRNAASVLSIDSFMLARGAIGGILLGTAATMPLVVVCIGARALGFSPATVLAATVGAGALCELCLFFGILRTNWTSRPNWSLAPYMR